MYTVRKLKNPPLCRNCHKPIPKHTVKVRVSYEEREKVASLADVQRLTNLAVVSINYEQTGSDRIGSAAYRKRLGLPRRVCGYSTWDGESYESDCFCKGPCATAYAYRIARASAASEAATATSTLKTENGRS